MKEIILNTKCGAIKGYEQGDCYIFRSIIYATAERFEMPVPTTQWEGTFDATQVTVDVPQLATLNKESEFRPDFYYQEFRKCDRDIPKPWSEKDLTLDIVVPKHAIDNHESLPVLTFIHGGGFETGMVSETPYGLCTEYAKHDIIYVSIGYRLNVFFLYCDEEHCGNYGLYDQQCALHWIQDNIADYGGDGSRITAMGQSAGAMCLTDHCLSRDLEGVVKGVILMSGAGKVPDMVGPLTPKQWEPFWTEVFKEAGVQNFERFKKLPAEKVWKAWYKVSRETSSFRFKQPGIDGGIIKKKPSESTKNGETLNVPYMVGVCSQDFMPLFIQRMALGWALNQEKHGFAPVYGYFFDRALPGNNYKAFHAADMWYMFGQMEKSDRPFGDYDKALSQRMIAYVARFVKTGDPNGDGACRWTPVTKAEKNFMLFDGEPEHMVTYSFTRKKLNHTFLKDHGPM